MVEGSSAAAATVAGCRQSCSCGVVVMVGGVVMNWRWGGGVELLIGNGKDGAGKVREL